MAVTITNENRIDNLESDYSQVLVKYAKLESEFEILKQEKDFFIPHDGDIY
jgi:hypothetical protein